MPERSRGVDWERVRERLRTSEKALQEALAESPERIAAAYHARAERLAKGEAQRKPVAPGLPVMVFRLGRERYAIELKELAEVVPFAGCASVPGAPPKVRGVINVRGELRAVLDLKSLLTPSASAADDSGFVLMLQRSRMPIGFRVDHIDELLEIRPEELGGPAQGLHVRGIAPGPVMLLNVETALAEVFSKEESLPT